MSMEPLDTPQQMILIRGYEWDKTLSPEQVQETMTKFWEWADSIEKRGILAGARPLSPKGYVVTGTSGTTISDGPFAELKEAVGGYFLLNLPTTEEALAIARQCPILAHGAILEVRPVQEMCHVMERLNNTTLTAQA